MNDHRKLPTQRMTTGFEKIFRQVSQNPDIYQQFTLHYIHILDSDGTRLSSKLDKSVTGDYYIEAKEHQHSSRGEYNYVFPDGIQRRIIFLREK